MQGWLCIFCCHVSTLFDLYEVDIDIYAHFKIKFRVTIMVLFSFDYYCGFVIPKLGGMYMLFI